MSHPVFAQKILKLTVDEVLAAITDHGTGYSKSREDNIIEEAFD